MKKEDYIEKAENLKIELTGEETIEDLKELIEKKEVELNQGTINSNIETSLSDESKEKVSWNTQSIKEATKTVNGIKHIWVKVIKNSISYNGEVYAVGKKEKFLIEASVIQNRPKLKNILVPTLEKSE